MPSLAQVEMPVRLASVPRISWMFARCAPGGGGGWRGCAGQGPGQGLRELRRAPRIIPRQARELFLGGVPVCHLSESRGPAVL